MTSTSVWTLCRICIGFIQQLQYKFFYDIRESQSRMEFFCYRLCPKIKLVNVVIIINAGRLTCHTIFNQ